MIVAFGSVPKDGGTFTFYRNIRPALFKYGIDMRCVAVGKAQAELWEEAYVDGGCVLLAPGTRNVKKQAMAFAEWCEREKVDIVMGINSEAILSSLQHLPERIRVMSRCANAFDHGYKITLSGRERLARIIATTPRLERDLINDYGADASKLRLIPNGIAAEVFEAAAASLRGQETFLRLGFLGRLEHNQKGVFYIPEIVRELKRLNVPFQLRIAGKGKHRSTIEREMRYEIAKGQVIFLGAIPAAEVPLFLETTDIFLFTSHFEGCPNALLEAIMAGCVPVSWLIEGITDFIIEDGKIGFISPMGDCQNLAGKVAILANNRELLQLMSTAATREGRERFSHRQCAEAYAKVIQEVMSEPPPAWIPKPWSEFRGDPNFTHTWTERLPIGFRSWIREFLTK